MSDATTVFASGYVYWPKIVGDPIPNYERTGNEWAFEFEPDDTTFLKDAKLLDRLKDPVDKPDEKNPEKGPYINLRKPEFTKDGKKNDPIRIYDGTGDADVEWDDRKIGNRSRVDIKLRIVDYGKGKKKGIYTTAIRVTELVPYVANEFGGMGKPAPAKKVVKSVPSPTVLEELDDDLPFD